nr:uncharacterized protein LOC127330411 [Lolium perenne]
MDEANLSTGGSCNATYSEDVINTAFGNSQTSTKENDKYTSSKTMCDDDPWGKNLFENMEFDQVLDINSSSTKPDNDHSKKTDNDSVKSSSSKAANEIAEEDTQT